MAITNVSSTNPLDQLARALANQFDANKDGTLTTGEFTSFLTQFLGSANALSTTGSNAVATDAATTATGLKGGTVAPTMLGFNSRKLADEGHDTVKYMFGRVAQRYSLESVHDKSTAEALLNTMKDDLAAEGLDVLAIEKDKIKIKDSAGKEVWLDVINSANTTHAAWQWLHIR
jgi:hypothetical protein